MKNTKNPKISLNPFSLLKDSLQEFKTYFFKLLIISAIVAIPGSLLRITTFDNGVTDFSILASIAGLYASLALYYALANPQRTQKDSWAKLYVSSSGRFLPYIGVTFIQGLIALIVILGFLLPILSFAGVITTGFAIFGVVIALVFSWLLIRLSLAAVITSTTQYGVATSLRASWLATKKRVIKLFFAWVFILALIIVLSGIILSGVYALPSTVSNPYIIAIINGILASFILPILISYSVHIWNRIKLA
jgi:hypothetical protein